MTDPGVEQWLKVHGAGFGCLRKDGGPILAVLPPGKENPFVDYFNSRRDLAGSRNRGFQVAGTPIFGLVFEGGGFLVVTLECADLWKHGMGAVDAK